MRVKELERELHAERPSPDPDFARRLDEWAAAGFPRDRGFGPRTAAGGDRRGGAFARLRGYLTTASPRQVLMPVGAVATLFVVAGVAISQSGGLNGDAEPLSVKGQEERTSGDSGGDAAGGDAGGALDAQEAPPAAAEEEAAQSELAPGETAVPVPGSPPIDDGGGAGGIARATESRIVDATARLTLGAEADEVREVANGVVETTDRYDGVVLDSQVTDDQAGARAAFTLELPYKQLDAALADLSELGDVISRTEAGEDITARAVRARKQLADTFDQIRRARIELIGAETREERLIVKARIDSLEATADAIRTDLNNVKRQGRFATVSVDVTSEGASAVDDQWSLGEALDDAGRVLEVLAGITLISLAVLVPLAVVGALAWLIVARSLRARRERALDSKVG